MKKFNIIAILALVTTLMFSSCNPRLVDFTIISSKNHSVKFDKKQGKRVTGDSMKFLGIGADIKEAMDLALESAGPEYDVLVNGVVYQKNYVFVQGFTVEGTAMISSELKAMMGDSAYEEWCLENTTYIK